MTIKQILRTLTNVIVLGCWNGLACIMGGALVTFLLWELGSYLLKPDFWKAVPETLVGLGLLALFATPGMVVVFFFAWLFSDDRRDDGDPSRGVRRGRRLGTSTDAQSRVARHGEAAKRRRAPQKSTPLRRRSLLSFFRRRKKQLRTAARESGTAPRTTARLSPKNSQVTTNARSEGHRP